ncbi:Response regulator receiver domain-containing protein [Pseudomonas frederiksbergensis]|jgi:Response regulator containing CheY-like receiver, AAA-type ATPase, and DNA-binding domains|uniref:Response regulator receiver domain-containing protein n=1 Tax=Pseudomonas frederiksbergensis TaxID=104087 RepID=A0A1P8EVZ5_9PSED|nr:MULTISPECIES: response regulator [Pseudomonas]APV40364.1 response regulator [Pseudomonas frederiksbergensis]PMU10633.1 response regulator [Pseudomonas sp. FW305-20]PMU20270.1 response regulator [Pseudomonas sp. FW305-122]PMU38939.1 response regulator [Pseudomonas sp. FW305-47B]PMX59025.1 response regulator [Pseudomonas sp. FW305-60]
MSDHDILSDAEREALSALMLEPALPTQRVLIVDDDRDARELLSQILELGGVRCITAASGETALKMLVDEAELKKLSIGLMITDLRMGNVDGLDLIRQVRESVRAALPIIIVSGDADVKDAIEAMHLSVVDFLLKPIDTDKLLALVKHELGMDV